MPKGVAFFVVRNTNYEMIILYYNTTVNRKVDYD